MQRTMKNTMKLSAPRVITWWIAVILGVLGILLHLGLFTVSALTPYIFWMVALAFVILAIATLIRKM